MLRYVNCQVSVKSWAFSFREVCDKLHIMWYLRFLKACEFAWFSSVSSECLCIFSLHGAMYIKKIYILCFTF